MYKKIVFIPLIALLLTGCNGPVDEYKDLLKSGDANVILIIGQSNASGNSPSEYLQTKNPEIYNKFKDGNASILTNYYVHVSNYIHFFEPTRFGMADSKKTFGPEIGIADVFSDSETPTYIIKYAIGGTCLDNEWLNTKAGRGKLYNESVNWFKEKMDYLKKNGVNPKIVGQFWMQGEGDANDQLGPKYENNLKSMINFYREDLKDYYVDHFSFVDAYISTKTLWPNPTIVNNSKQHVADKDPYVFCIKTNGEDENAINLDVKSHSNEGDDAAHYDCVSEVLLGQAAGKIIKENL